jgi:hypothetical protein
MRQTSERGIALLTTLMLMMLVSALLVGFTAVVMSDQRFRGTDRTRTAAFYAAHAGLERLTADLGNLFSTNVAPTGAQVTALTVTPPPFDNMMFVAADGTTGYKILFPTDAAGNPQATSRNIASGPYQGLIGLLTPYTIDVTARTIGGGEVHLQRSLETVAIPVFQFGMFSDVDLSFFAGPNFNFGGRVHTNGNLFLSSGSTLTLSDTVTAVGEVVREELSNGVSIDTPSAHNGTVTVVTAPGAFRPLLRTEGSVVDMPGTAPNDPTWTNVSLSIYNGHIRNGRTGAKSLKLPLITAGGSNPDLVRRPATADENVTKATLFASRYFSRASVRILLSDTAADILNLPGVTPTAPVLLDGNWNAAPPAGYGPVAANRPPVALSVGSATTALTTATGAGDGNIQVGTTAGFVDGNTIWINGTRVQCAGSTATKFTGCKGTPAAAVGTQVVTGALTPAGTGTIGGYLKIELQDSANVWHDVTVEILRLGIASTNLAGTICGDPTPNAILKIQRLRDNGTGAPCDYGNSLNPTDYWPQVLFDPREALVRDTAPGATLLLGGVMHYMMLDVANLSRWLQGAIGATGNTAISNNGFTVYFSDRRANRNAANQETGEYGWEDTVNPASAAGLPNGVIDLGEDVNENGTLDVYGQFPSYNGVASTVAPGSVAPLDAAARPWTGLTMAQAQVNRAVLFRRALKLVNGGLGNIVAPGLTIVAENPVYIQGDWNASVAAGFGNPHAATSVIADAVTLLSNAWSDINAFTSPYSTAGRNRSANTYYRVAIIGGKGPSFPQPPGGWAAVDFGTDGGAHNFLRMLEQGGTVNYVGSIATFYFNRQATGTFKCCTTVYGAPTRNFAFDTDFLDPTKLPPLTPVFRDLNTLSFSQVIQAGK